MKTPRDRTAAASTSSTRPSRSRAVNLARTTKPGRKVKKLGGAVLRWLRLWLWHPPLPVHVFCCGCVTGNDVYCKSASVSVAQTAIDSNDRNDFVGESCSLSVVSFCVAPFSRRSPPWLLCAFGKDILDHLRKSRKTHPWTAAVRETRAKLVASAGAIPWSRCRELDTTFNGHQRPLPRHSQYGATIKERFFWG